MNEEVIPDYQIDIDKLPTTKTIHSMHQEGNFLVMLTDTGIRFRQRIKPGKMLIEKDGVMKLVDMGISVG